MIPIDYEEGQRVLDAGTNCECGAGLTLAWGGSCGIERYVLKCAKDITHDRLARPAKLGPYDIPGWNLSPLKGRRSEMEERLGKDTARRLIKYEGVGALTREMAEGIIKTIWPKAPQTERVKAALLCRDYGLNPLMKHVFLIPFKNNKTGETTWEILLGIKATRLIAFRQGFYSYLDGTPRVMSAEEQEKTFGKVDDANICAITIIRTPNGSEAQGYGKWPKGKDVYGGDKGNSEYNMAFIRSERNALDKLFPGAMPLGVEVVDERYVPRRATTSEESLPEDPAPPKELQFLGVEVIDEPDAELLRAWEIVKSKVKGLRLQDAQLAKWFRVGYGIEVSLADFEQEKPPEKFTPAMLSKFVDSLLLYEERG